MKKIPPGFLLPSAALTVSKKQIRNYLFTDKKPVPGDLVYLRVTRMGHHVEIENKEGRIHNINDGSALVGVFGNRYAPDCWEGLVPDSLPTETDLLARSGMVGTVQKKSSQIKDPTRVKVLGYVVNDEQVLNTRDFCVINPIQEEKKPLRSKMILVVGTSMNSGKSKSAQGICWALSTAGHGVRASKITGTASLKDVLGMEDAGASPVTDFTHFGYPSTYLLEKDELLTVFNHTDLKIANNPKNYWVVELADGILQRETEILLNSDEVKSRIHRLVFAAHGAMGAVAGIQVLKDVYNLTPDIISGKCSSSPLAMQEFERLCAVPSFDNMNWDLEQMVKLLI